MDEERWGECETVTITLYHWMNRLGTEEKCCSALCIFKPIKRKLEGDRWLSVLMCCVVKFYYHQLTRLNIL